jgi:hypothetical protein
LVNSPDFSDNENLFDPEENEHAQDNEHASSPESKFKFNRRWLFAGLGLIAIVLTALNIYQSIVQFGAIDGYIRDTDGRVLQAEVFIMGTNDVAYSDASGYFKLDRVPAGEQNLIINYNGITQIYDVNVPLAGQLLLDNLVVDTDVTN